MLKHLRRLSAFALAMFIYSLSLSASNYDFSPNAKIPTDPNVRIGILTNGMKYYVRANAHPTQRAELRLVCLAGSIEEEDSQDGLAHNLEHMLFNGTKHFPKDELLGFLQRIGMRFGADINANTSIDRTIYFLQVPTDDKNILDTAFQVLEDWAHLATLEAEEIDKERGVIIEEWRQRMNAKQRLLEKHTPVMTNNSKWGKRNIIGSDTNLLRNYQYEEIRRFYRDWYRPDLQAIVAVGDFDPDDIENKIKKQFSHISVAPEAPKFHRPEIMDFNGIRVSIAQDPEFPAAMLRLDYKKSKHKITTIKDYRREATQKLYDQMFSQRLVELMQESDPPFLKASAGLNSYVAGYKSYNLSAISKPEALMTAFRALLSEGFRVKQHGFTASELERAKANYLSSVRKAYSERDKQQSAQFASEYIRNYLASEYIPGIDYEYSFIKHILPEITLEEVNGLSNNLMIEKNCVITLWLPEKEGLIVPNQNELLAVYKEIENSSLTSYHDELVSSDLMKTKPRGGTIISQSKIEEIDAIDLKLSNGARIIIKPTDLKNDEILFNCISYGGTSLASDEDFKSATIADQLVRSSGYGDFNIVQLQKALAGKNLNMRPSIGINSESISGKTTPKDLVTFLQLVYLAFTAPRFDDDACKAMDKRLRTTVENASLNPNSVFKDSANAIMGNYHPRSLPTTMEDIENINYKKAFEFYKERFADASDFTFIMVGNIDLPGIKPLLETYLAGLPSINRNESWRDTELRLPKGKIQKNIYAGIMDKSTVNLCFKGTLKWNLEEIYFVRSLLKLLDMKLREQIREEKGGSYGAYSSFNPYKFPASEYRINISFSCDSKRVDELIETAYDQVRDLQENLQDESYIQKVNETIRRNHETNIQNNSFWLRMIYLNTYHGDAFKYIADQSEIIEKFDVDMVRKLARKYFDFDETIEFVLYAEQDKPTNVGR